MDEYPLPEDRTMYDEYGLPELCEEVCDFLDEFVKELDKRKNQLPADSVLHTKIHLAVAALQDVVSETQRDPVLKPSPLFSIN